MRESTYMEQHIPGHFTTQNIVTIFTMHITITNIISKHLHICIHEQLYKVTYYSRSKESNLRTWDNQLNTLPLDYQVTYIEVLIYTS